MPPKKSTKTSAAAETDTAENADSVAIKFTPADTKLLSLSYLCMDQQPKIDHEKLAGLAGYTVGSCKTIWGTLKRKIQAMDPGENAAGATASATISGAAAPTATTPANTPKKRGRKPGGTPKDSPAGKKQKGKQNKSPIKNESINVAPYEYPETPTKLKQEAEDDAMVDSAVEHDSGEADLSLPEPLE